MKQIPIRHLHSVQQALSDTGRFNIRKVEDIVGDKDLFHDLHRHDFFFLLAIQNGTGRHEIDFTHYNILPDSVFFLRPGQVHQLELKAGSAGYLVEFDQEFYHPKDKQPNQRLRKASNKNYCALESTRFQRLQHILFSMLEEYAAKEDGYQDFIRSSLDIFFIEFVRQSAHPAGETKTAGSYVQERFEEFSALLDDHSASHKQVSDYTALMNLSAYQLNEITKSSVGKTASELINGHILLEAKRYLLATANQVKDIADILGYEDPSYFIRFFKKHIGQSPESFRQHFR